MNSIVNKQFVKATVFATAAFTADFASAAVSFNSHADLSFIVDSIVETGTENAVDYSSLQVFGSMIRPVEPDVVTWSVLTGDGVVDDNGAEIPYTEGSVVLGNVFNHSFSISGQLNSGILDYSQVAWYEIGFNNNAETSFDISLRASYTLATEINGQVGSASVGLSLYDDNQLYWTDMAIGESGAPGYATFEQAITLTVLPGENRRFYLDVGHDGYIEAAPVPLPAALWPFMAGLVGIFGFKKRTTFASQPA
ncbi:MAG: hypothetical protein PHH11_14220 [Methylomonas sp.]|nr:hypothetical protein [Methylomonas sp.]